MNKKFNLNKFIAKEILVIVSLSVLIVIGFFIGHFYYKSHNKEIFKNTRSLRNERDDVGADLDNSISTSLSSWSVLYSNLRTEFDLRSEGASKDRINIMIRFKALRDSIDNIEEWFDNANPRLKEQLKYSGVYDGNDLIMFVDSNYYDTSEINEYFNVINKNEIKRDDYDARISELNRSRIEKNEFWETFYNSTIVFLSSVYLIRIIAWSIRTLRVK